MRRRRVCIFVLGIVLVLGHAGRADALWKIFGWLDEMSGPGPFKGNLLTFEVFCAGELPKDEDEVYRQLFVSMFASPTEMQPSEMPATAVPQVKQAPSAALPAAAGTNQAQTDALAALDAVKQSRRCRYDRSNVRYSVVLEAGWWNDQPNAKYDGNIAITSMESVAYVPLQKAFGRNNARLLRSIEVGGGLGVYRMSGPGVVDRDYWRGAFPIRVRLMPSEWLPNAWHKNQRQRRFLQAIQIRAGWDYLPGFLASSQFVVTPGGGATDSKDEWVPTYGITLDLGAVFWSLFEPPPTPLTR